MKVSIVIPTYNEQENIQSSLAKALSFLKKQPYDFEIIVSDDGSIDHTRDVVKEVMKKEKTISLLKNSHIGKAEAVKRGILRGKGDIILFTDADFATPIETINKVFACFEKGADVVIGSRAEGKREKEPLSRKIAGKGYNILVQLILLPGINDSQAGFKAFTHDAAQKIFSNLVLFGENQKESSIPKVTGFDVEVLFLARKLGYKIASVPIEWEYKNTNKVNVIRDSIALFIDLLLVRWYSASGKYEHLK